MDQLIEPIEHLAGLRAIPTLMFPPADARETQELGTLQ